MSLILVALICTHRQRWGELYIYYCDAGFNLSAIMCSAIMLLYFWSGVTEAGRASLVTRNAVHNKYSPVEANKAVDKFVCQDGIKAFHTVIKNMCDDDKNESQTETFPQCLQAFAVMLDGWTEIKILCLRIIVQGGLFKSFSGPSSVPEQSHLFTVDLNMLGFVQMTTFRKYSEE